MSHTQGARTGAPSQPRLAGGRGARPVLAAAAALTALLALAACGSSSNSKPPHAYAVLSQNGKTPTSESPSQTPPGLHPATIKITTTAPLPSGAIDPRYTCHGANISPPFKWHGLQDVAPHTKEVLLFVRSIDHGNITTHWGLAGLNPSLSEVKAGQTPPGAIVAKNGEGKVGYSLCPSNSSFVTFAVYALPHKLGLKQGFDPEKLRPQLETTEVQWGGVTMVAYVPPTSAHK